MKNLFTFAILILLFTSCGSRDNTYIDTSSNESIRITDVGVDEGADTLYPKMSISLRNVGTNTFLINKVNVIVTSTRRLAMKPGCELGAFEVTGEYTMDFPVGDGSYTLSKDVSQSVNPNSVDAFNIYINTLEGNGYTLERPTIVFAKVQLEYDGNQSVTSNEFVFFNIPLWSSCGFNDPFGSSIPEDDKRFFLELSKRDIQKSPATRQFIRVAEQNCDLGHPMISCGDEMFPWTNTP